MSTPQEGSARTAPAEMFRARAESTVHLARAVERCGFNVVEWFGRHENVPGDRFIDNLGDLAGAVERMIQDATLVLEAPKGAGR